MSLVSARFLTLTKRFPAAFFGEKCPDEIIQRAHSSPILEVVGGLVNCGLVVTENSDGVQASQVAEIPLCNSISYSNFQQGGGAEAKVLVDLH